MEMVSDLEALAGRSRGGAVAIGNFDGVHRGHAKIVERVIHHARQDGGPAIVFTFDPHPVRLLRPDIAPPPLTWNERKAELLQTLGVDVMVCYPTDESLLDLSAAAFFDQIICRQLGVKAIVEGPNFCFGKNRAGTVDTLRELCAAAGITLEIVAPLCESESYISSSRIRQLIAAGDVAEAAKMLTSPYRIRGTVTHGARRGSKIGFPTANLEAIDTLVPAPGVYSARGLVGEQWWPAAVNIGPNPTFGEQSFKVEVHLIGFAGSLYGQPLAVDFAARLRDIQTFESVDALQAQLRRDIAACDGR